MTRVLEFSAGFVFATIVYAIIFNILIFCGELPRYTADCTNGRRVYLEDGHHDEWTKLCAALGGQAKP